MNKKLFNTLLLLLYYLLSGSDDHELPADQESQTGSSGDTESIRGGMAEAAVESVGVSVAIDTSGKNLDEVASELVTMAIHNATLELQNEVCG